MISLNKRTAEILAPQWHHPVVEDDKTVGKPDRLNFLPTKVQ